MAEDKRDAQSAEADWRCARSVRSGDTNQVKHGRQLTQQSIWSDSLERSQGMKSFREPLPEGAGNAAHGTMAGGKLGGNNWVRRWSKEGTTTRQPQTMALLKLALVCNDDNTPEVDAHAIDFQRLLPPRGSAEPDAGNGRTDRQNNEASVTASASDPQP